jgi:cobalt-zinc-cadmium efflux system outer membrane protein
LKEVERLKAFQLSLESEQRNIINQIAQLQNNLMILIGAKGFPYTVPTIDKNVTDTLGFAKIPLLSLIDSAKVLRYDVKAAEKTVKYDQQFLSLQKATGVPDVQLGALFDRNGSYIPNYLSANISTNLPFFNRNQGNIKFAQFKIKSDQALFEGSKLQLEKDVWEAYTMLLQSDSQYKRFDPNFTTDYQKLMVGIVSNFEKRSISTLEFLDFYESYKNSVLQYNQLQSDRLNSLENLNFTVGKTLFKY